MSRVALRTLLDRSANNMAVGTHPVVRDSAFEMIKLAYKEGINVQISEGYRSNTRQNQLYAQGRTTKGNIVTFAKAGQSWHNHGIGIDFFVTSYDGTKATWNVNANWKRAAQIGKSLGFEWGGDWTSFKDYPHLQMRGGLSLADFRAGKRPNLKMKDGSKTSPPKQSKPKSKGTPSKYKDVGDNWTGQNLKKYDKGGKVKDLQKLIKVKSDGFFGNDTEKGVINAQRKAGLIPDGIAGKKTHKSLNTKSANLKVDGFWGKATTTALQEYYGTTVDGVLSNPSLVIKKLQGTLNVKADGIFGPTSIRAMQRRFGTPVDGVISKPSAVIKGLQKRLNNGKL